MHTIEHTPTNNDLATDYVGVTYLYMEKPPSCDRSFPPLRERTVVDFTGLVFSPDWCIPIMAFTFRQATLTKMDEMVAGQKVGFLRMTAGSKDNWFGAPFLGLECDFPTAGKYQVSIEAVRGPKQACVQLFRNEIPAGLPVDLYAAERSRSGLTAMGTIDVIVDSFTMSNDTRERPHGRPSWTIPPDKTLQQLKFRGSFPRRASCPIKAVVVADAVTSLRRSN